MICLWLLINNVYQLIIFFQTDKSWWFWWVPLMLSHVWFASSNLGHLAKAFAFVFLGHKAQSIADSYVQFFNIRDRIVEITLFMHFSSLACYENSSKFPHVTAACFSTLKSYLNPDRIDLLDHLRFLKFLFFGQITKPEESTSIGTNQSAPNPHTSRSRRSSSPSRRSSFQSFVYSLMYRESMLSSG